MIGYDKIYNILEHLKHKDDVSAEFEEVSGSFMWFIYNLQKRKK